MAGRKLTIYYRNSIKKRLTCLLTTSIILGIALTIGAVSGFYLFFFSLSKDEVVSNLVELKRTHMKPVG